MEEEMKGTLSDQRISALGASIAGKVAKKVQTKSDALKVLEVAKVLLSMRIKD